MNNMHDFYDSRRTDLLFIDKRLSLALRFIGNASPSALLDVGCGHGALLKELKRRFPHVQLAGCDIAASSVEAVRAMDIQAHVGNVEGGLPFEDSSFDCVFFGEILEHLVDPDSALRELSRVLREGGNLILTTPNLASWFNRILLLFGVQPVFTETSLSVNLGRKHRLLGQWMPAVGHLKVFTKDALCEMLDANGFKVVELKGAPFDHPTPFGWLDRIFANNPSFASNFVVRAYNTRTLRSSYTVGERVTRIEEEGVIESLRS